MKVFLSFIFFVLIHIPLNLFAEDDKTPLLNHFVHMQKERDYYNIFNDGYWKEATWHLPRVLAAPLEWNEEEWFNAATVVAIGYGVYLSDDKVRDLAQRDGSQKLNDEVTHYAERFGRGIVVLPGLGLLYAVGDLTDNERFKKVSLVGLESAVYSTLITATLKSVTGRDRPNEGNGSGAWNVFGSGGKSFPSGHTDLAFSAATVIAEEYQDYQLVPYIVYGLAGATAAERILDDKHWASDVFAGAIIGHFTAKAIMGYHEENEDRVQMIPLVEDRDNFSLNFAIRF